MTYLRKNIADMAGYVPGFQPQDEAQWIKLNTNENPYPPSPKVHAAIAAELGDEKLDVLGEDGELGVRVLCHNSPPLW